MDLLQKLYHDALETHNLNPEDINFGVNKLISYGYSIDLLTYLVRNYYVGKFSIKLNQIIDQSIKQKANIPSFQIKWYELENTHLSIEEIKELSMLEQIQKDAMFNLIEYLKQNQVPKDNIFTGGLYRIFLDDICNEIEYSLENFDIIIKEEENRNTKYLTGKKIKYLDIFKSKNPRERKLLNEF